MVKKRKFMGKELKVYPHPTQQGDHIIEYDGLKIIYEFFNTEVVDLFMQDDEEIGKVIREGKTFAKVFRT